ncbi:hypothetical protein [Nocardioides convexus]|uniref:hypothetical protein n=1 Tax=Nocardioides convexus TaxID=2712224 RepID=UPI0024184687|nr:hypothetical protein [Nocardioides convexus]
MSGAQKVAAFAVIVVVAFAAALGIGRAVGPIDTEETGHGHEATHEEMDEGAEPVASEQPVLDLDRTRYDAGRQRLTFTLRTAGGSPITAYEVQHEKQAPPGRRTTGPGRVPPRPPHPRCRDRPVDRAAGPRRRQAGGSTPTSLRPAAVPRSPRPTWRWPGSSPPRRRRPTPPPRRSTASRCT